MRGTNKKAATFKSRPFLMLGTVFAEKRGGPIILFLEQI